MTLHLIQANYTQRSSPQQYCVRKIDVTTAGRIERKQIRSGRCVALLSFRSGAAIGVDNYYRYRCQPRMDHE